MSSVLHVYVHALNNAVINDSGSKIVNFQTYDFLILLM